MAAEEPANQPAAVNSVEKAVQNGHRAVLGEAVAVGTAEGVAAKEPPHLLTPLAALWPTATLPKPPTVPEGPAPTAPQIVRVKFVLFDLGAKQVSLCGDFNRWASDAEPMKRGDAGHWETTLALAPGRYQYKFIVDGQWIPDPLAHEQVWNYHGTLNSVVEVRL